jgi:hypothetical protein
VPRRRFEKSSPAKDDVVRPEIVGLVRCRKPDPAILMLAGGEPEKEFAVLQGRWPRARIVVLDREREFAERAFRIEGANAWHGKLEEVEPCPAFDFVVLDLCGTSRTAEPLFRKWASVLRPGASISVTFQVGHDRDPPFVVPGELEALGRESPKAARRAARFFVPGLRFVTWFRYWSRSSMVTLLFEKEKQSRTASEKRRCE